LVWLAQTEREHGAKGGSRELAAAGGAGRVPCTAWLQHFAGEENLMARWTTRDIPDQSGRTVLITRGNAGLGYQTALQLAGRGARVLLAARDRSRGAAALERLGAEAPASHAELVQLDLADLGSVERFSTEFMANGQGLDLLVNNAG